MRRAILIIVLISSILGCKKGKGPTPATPEPVPAPAKAMLVAPAQNEACLSGTSISTTQSAVTFTWNSAANAESYDVVIKNLLTNTSSTHSAIQATVQVNLLKNTPYSWHVVAKSSKTAITTASDSWKFYNSGTAEVSYAPFPAEAVNPAGGQAVTAANGKILLDWTTSDVDNDIVSYAVYLGTTSTPTLLNANVATSELADVPVASNTTYYWKIITKDSSGNTSDSGVFSFRVN